MNPELTWFVMSYSYGDAALRQETGIRLGANIQAKGNHLKHLNPTLAYL